MDRIIKPGDERLTGGLKPAELVSRAEKWWDAKGRHLAGKTGMKRFNIALEGAKLSFSKRGPLLRVAPVETPILGSGLLRGLRWAELTRTERFHVCKAWHRQWLMEKTRDVVPDYTKPEEAAAIEAGHDPAKVRARRVHTFRR